MRRSIQQRSCKLVVEFFPRLRNQSRLTGWFMVCQTRNPNPISRLIGPRGAGPTIYIPYSFPAETLKARAYNNVCTSCRKAQFAYHIYCGLYSLSWSIPVSVLPVWSDFIRLKNYGQSLIGKGTSNSSSFLDPCFLLQPVTTWRNESRLKVAATSLR